MKSSVSLKSLLRLDKIQAIYFSHSFGRSAFHILEENLSLEQAQEFSQKDLQEAAANSHFMSPTLRFQLQFTDVQKVCFITASTLNLSSCNTDFQLHLEVFGQPWHTCSVSLIPDCFSATGETPLVSWAAGTPVRPSAVQPTTVMPPSRLSVSAELLLVMLPHREDLSTWLESASWDPSSPAG